VTIAECTTYNLRYIFGYFQGKHGFTHLQQIVANHGDEGWDSKVGKDAGSECAISNTFNAIVETYGTPKRIKEGMMVNPPE
jgi:hypothetical protein